MPMGGLVRQAAMADRIAARGAFSSEEISEVRALRDDEKAA
jgi:hypothetical protein